MKFRSIPHRSHHSKCAGAVILATLALTSGASTAGTIYFDFNLNEFGGVHTPSLFLFGDAGQTANVSNLAGFNQNVVLSADGFFNLPIPLTYQQSGTGVQSSGFKVLSPDPIAGYFVNRKEFTTDMTYLLDEEALGTDYVVASDGGAFGEGSQVMIHATQDNTSVTFTPKGGAPINVVLQSGQTYKYAGGTTNLTGSTVSSDKDVAVFGGHSCTQVPDGVVACDNLIEQMIPNDKLSKTYALAASEPATEALALNGAGRDLVRVIAPADNTEIKVNGVVVATLNAGDYYEFSLQGDSGALVEANEPIMVAQYLTGQGENPGVLTDPAMSVVPGADAWLDEYRLATPAGAQAFANNYAAIVAETADLTSLQLDGFAIDVSGFTPIVGTAYSRGLVDLPIGLFDLTGASPFLVMLGGGDDYDSYLTYGGSTFAPGVSPPPGPVPAPASLALLAVGLAGIGAGRRLRK